MTSLMDLIDDGSASPVDPRQPIAWYHRRMDSLLYRTRDSWREADRVDRYLTLLFDSEKQLVGFRLKGFLRFFSQVRDRLHLKDTDFSLLVAILELALVGGGGDQLMAELKVVGREGIKSEDWWERVRKYLMATRLVIGDPQSSRIRVAGVE